MRLQDAINIADLRRMAKRRLPKMLYDGIESGVDDERCVDRNTDLFRQHRLFPRYLVDVSTTDQTTTLLGRTYSSPFGVAPIGFAGGMRRGAEMMLARAAAAANLPFILSGASIASIEQVAAVARENTWCHIYAAKDAAITSDIMRRAREAGVETLVLTVDVPTFPNRETNTRNGYTVPLKRLRVGTILEALTHPAWVVEYLTSGGLPKMESWARYAGPNASAADIAVFFRSQSPSVQTWEKLERMRAEWPGKLVVKGIQHPEDARRAAAMGVDGIIVSNHGAKVFDPLPSPLETLPAVKAAVGDRVAVMLDSGVRRGTDIVIARCLGAECVFTGRATLYGVVAGGEAGAMRAIDILKRETAIALAMVGCPRAEDLGSDFLYESARAEPAAEPASSRTPARLVSA